MPNPKPANTVDSELSAISAVYKSLATLGQSAQVRVLAYVCEKLGIPFSSNQAASTETLRAPYSAPTEPERTNPRSDALTDAEPDGINDVGKKWLKRNGIGLDALKPLLSIGDPEIDVIAKSVPGSSKRARMKSVLLLRGIASILSDGSARVTHEQLKETCAHYDAFDSPNFAAHLKNFSAVITGSKRSGYTLSSRGLAEASELIKSMSSGSSDKD
jgi:hypothetical protein